MELLGEIGWEEVFDLWKKREGNDEAWIKCATEIKGWPDWESWRRFSMEQIGAQGRQWKHYVLNDPLSEIPAMLVGPYSGWQSRHPDTNNFSFADLLERPEQYEQWKTHSKIISLIDNFPADSEFIGLIREDNGRIVCLEGHHRAVAVALAEKDGRDLVFHGSQKISLTTLPRDEIHLLDEMLKRGSSKTPPA